MKNILLTIDWDYFMPYINVMNTSYLENRRNIIDHWYAMYLENKSSGKDITKTMRCGDILPHFWDMLFEHFSIDENTKLVVSDSHKKAYDVAKKYSCDAVYNFDSHTDLGYGGLKSLDFEVNCANWLGKLLKDKVIEDSNVILSPYSIEYEEEFNEINNEYDVHYLKFDELKKDMYVKAIHICRSGAWTAPWLDDEFSEFVKEPGISYKKVDLEKRNWNAENITLAQQIECMLF